MMEVQKYNRLKVDVIISFYLQDFLDSDDSEEYFNDIDFLIEQLDEEAVIFELSDYEVIE